MTRPWKLVGLTALYVALWGSAMVLVPAGLAHGLVQLAGFPGLCAWLLAAKRWLP